MTAKKIPPVIVNKPYKETFNNTKSYMQRCFPGANLRANLYTDIPEGEIILDRLPPATLFFMGGVVTSSYESAREIVNLRFVGDAAKTSVFTKTEFSRDLALSAIENKACPTQK
jgi:hypothetical protein